MTNVVAYVDPIPVHPGVILGVILGLLALAAAAYTGWLLDTLRRRIDEQTGQIEELQRLNRHLTNELLDARGEIRDLRDTMAANTAQLQATQCRYPEQLAALGKCPGTPPLQPGERSLLVVVGQKEMLRIDLAMLRATDMRFMRMNNPTMSRFRDTINQARAEGKPWRNLHLAMDMSEAGAQFADGIASGEWLSEQLDGVEILLLAGCESSLFAGQLGVVPCVISMGEKIDNKDAALFTRLFWEAVGQGKSGQESFDQALQRCPPAVAEFAEAHS